MDLPTSKHLFLLTKDANFLSNIPSFSSGYSSMSLIDITKPKILSPKNSNFSKLLTGSKALNMERKQALINAFTLLARMARD